jgi:hypothetical protein
MKEQKFTARIILELLGSPEEHINQTLKDVVNKVKEEKEIKVVKAKLFDAEQQENKLWSAFAEIELESKDMKRILDLCFDYMPSTIEILEPAGMEMDSEDIASLFNDLLAKLHKYDMLLKNFHAENVVMKKQLEEIHKKVEEARAKKAKE